MAKIKKFKSDQNELKASAAKTGEALKKDRDTSTASMMSEMASKRSTKPTAPAASKGQSFGAAFAAARKAGDKTFSWKGKSFTTQMAGEKKSSPASAPATKTKDYAPKGGFKGSAPSSMVGKSAPSMLKKSPGKNSSDYTGPVKSKGNSSDYVPMSSRGPQSGFPSAAKPAAKSAPKPAAKDQWSGAKAAPMLTKMPPKNSSDYKGAARKAKGGSIDGCATKGKTKAGRK
jgi:hypothetical protein